MAKASAIYSNADHLTLDGVLTVAMSCLQVIYPALRLFWQPSQGVIQEDSILELTRLEHLYRIFERCWRECPCSPCVYFVLESSSRWICRSPCLIATRYWCKCLMYRNWCNMCGIVRMLCCIGSASQALWWILNNFDLFFHLQLGASFSKRRSSAAGWKFQDCTNKASKLRFAYPLSIRHRMAQGISINVSYSSRVAFRHPACRWKWRAKFCTRLGS